ncbi:DUF4331 family protein [Sediminicola sp. 1XM1-17]|uniref:DUF4331 family protein n=1 Tax=Sediminicola sp. 1XM1-17 TaxID=3127702 RepID=UPI0030775732
MKLYNIKTTFLSVLAVAALASCSNDDDMTMEPTPMGTDFSGTYTQADHMGRPGINTVFSADINGQTNVKNSFNRTIPSQMNAQFQAGFEARLEQYHDVYAELLGFQPEDVNYETNILGLDATTLTTVLANDALDVAPDMPTTYFNGTQVLTGRALADDVIDISLTLLFGGETGARFSGQDTNNDGNADLPRLTSDGVALTATLSTSFPYLGAPN